MHAHVIVLALATAATASLYGESNLNHTCQLSTYYNIPISRDLPDT